MNKETERNSTALNSEKTALPTYLLSMRIANYRCFGPEQVLDLSRGEGLPAQWTIILGDNGVGKTTLLQCLAAAQSERNGPADSEHFYMPSSKRVQSLDITSQRFGKLVYPDFSLEYAIHCGEILDSSHSRVETYKIALGKYEDRPELDWVVTSVTSPYLSHFLIYGYGASRSIGKTSLSDAQANDTSASLFSDVADLLNAEEWLLQTDYAANRVSANSERAEKRRDQVINTLIDLLPEVNGIQFVDSKSIGAPTVEFKTPYGWVPLKGLSLGYRTLITWMVDLASRLFERYPDSPNPLAEPAIVLVDEIDLHLHPRWQRTLMQFLTEKFPNTQFIATAHSPLVVQSAVDANIVLLRQVGDHVVIDNDVETIKNWRVDQILTSELFGLESARPPQSDAAMAERNTILAKARLTKADEKRLEELERQIGNLPTGETPEDLQAMDIIRRAAQLLKTE